MTGVPAQRAVTGKLLPMIQPATERRVTGECTPGCGVCCKVIGLPTVNPITLTREGNVLVDLSLAHGDPRLQDKDWVHFLTTRGIDRTRGGRRLVVPLDLSEAGPDATVGDAQKLISWGHYGPQRTPMVYLISRCLKLGDDGMCSIYGQPERPVTCSKWPTPMDQITEIPLVSDVCTYRIEEVPIDHGQSGGDQEGHGQVGERQPEGVGSRPDEGPALAAGAGQGASAGPAGPRGDVHGAGARPDHPDTGSPDRGARPARVPARRDHQGAKR